MKAKLESFGELYRESFEAYLRDHDERGLSAAYELGRSAYAQQLSVLDLAAVHQDAMLSALGHNAESEAEQEVIRAAGDFFLESLSAFDIVQRALQEAREAAQLERHQAMILQRLSSFLADASLALDASDSLEEMLQLVAEHARELVGAEQSAARLDLPDGKGTISAAAIEQRDVALASQLDDLAALFRAIRPPGGSLRMTGADLERYGDHSALAGLADANWQPRGWLVAALTALDGRELGLIQAFDKSAGDFSELDEAVLVQLAQMASAAVERADTYRRGG